MRDYARLKSELLVDLCIESTETDRPVTSDMGVSECARYSLANSFYKKLCPKGNSRTADENALKKFKAINESIPEEYAFGANSEAESCFYDYFKNHLNNCLGVQESIESFDLDSIRMYMGVGPGAAQLADSSTLHTKLFEGEMSYTNEDLIKYYRAALVETGFWADAEMRRFQKFGFTRVPGGKIFFASKNAEISRTCCTEANLNMLIQKAIGTFMEFRANWYFGISLSTQPDRNRELARIGSLDGSFGTIDSISASDSIGERMLHGSLDHSFLKTMIWKSRSETAVLPNGEEVRLRMISTMGNGFTFPLQTIIFASAVKAVYDLMGFPSDCAITQFGVFGDDIIVRREAYDFLIAMLTKLGFSVNVGKSFNTGPFRESCGNDYYNGRDVRGVYVKTLETPQSVSSLINRLNRWSARHGILLPRTMALLYSWIRVLPVPPSESDDAGIHVPFKLTKPRLNESYWFKYRAFKRKVERRKVDEPDSDSDGGPFNPDGIAVGFLSGYLRRRDYVPVQTDLLSDKSGRPPDLDWGISITLRDKVGARARYQIVDKVIPYWDYYLPDTMMEESSSDMGLSWRRRRDPPSRRVWEDTVMATYRIDM